jgi:hypothetical protein
MNKPDQMKSEPMQFNAKQLDLQGMVERVLPGSELLSITAFGIDEGTREQTEKGAGYGEPLKLEIQTADGRREHLVFHTECENPFGHQRRADRAGDMLLAFDTFSKIPQHAEALDVGAIESQGNRLVSLRGVGEFYLLTRFVPGHPYARELRALSERGSMNDSDELHCRLLAQYLAELHCERPEALGLYRRSVRDLIGSGEGIMGIIDGYPDSISSDLQKRLQNIESRCQEWRWKLRKTENRLVRIHGDIHPFNIVFDDDELHLLDASRGCMGDAADDLACLSINYLFFGLLTKGRARKDYRWLFRHFFEVYLTHRPDEGFFQTIAPYFAWRGLVLANPAWYPKVSEQDRRHLLGFIELCLDAPSFDLALGEDFLA